MFSFKTHDGSMQYTSQDERYVIIHNSYMV